MLFFGEERVLNWISSYLPTQEEFKTICFTTGGQRTRELWSFVYVTSENSYAIDLSSLISSLVSSLYKQYKEKLNINRCPYIFMANMMEQVATV